MDLNRKARRTLVKLTPDTQALLKDHAKLLAENKLLKAQNTALAGQHMDVYCILVGILMNQKGFEIRLPKDGLPQLDLTAYSVEEEEVGDEVVVKMIYLGGDDEKIVS